MKSIQTLTHGMIDYAGLFPPAKLSVAHALAEYDSFGTHTHRNMISRFVVPLARLPELTEAGAEYFERVQNAPNTPWHFSVLAKAVPSASEAIASLHQEFATLRDFALRFKKAVVIDSLEMVIPEEILAAHDSHMMSAFLERLASEIDAILPNLRTFLEISWKYPSERVMWALKNFNPTRTEPFYLKLRTGGLTPESIVPAELLAKTIKQCREMQLGFKATAGLHEPMRHFDATVGANLHGFLNLFTAAGLAFSKGISIAEINAILEDENPAHFVFTDRTVKYLGPTEYVLNTAELEATRRLFVLGFGSCSFIEPVQMLTEMGLLSSFSAT